VPDLVTLASQPHLLLVRWRNVVMLGMRTSPTAETIDRMSAEVHRLRKQGARGTALIHLVRSLDRKPPPPDPETREAYLRMMRDKNTPVRCSAVIMTDSGFTAALARSVLTGLMLITRPAYSTKVFSSEREACEWIVDELGTIDAGCGSVDELMNALQELASMLEAQLSAT
jgi:hypothetical protein